MIHLIQNTQDYNNDLRAMIMAFFPGIKIVETVNENDEIDFTLEALFDPAETKLSLDKHEAVVAYDYRDKAVFRNKLKLAVYDILTGYTGRRLPWGDLTGVRPTKIAMSLLKNGKNASDAVSYYQEVYAATEQKARLATDVAALELKLTKDIDLDNDYCLYVGIPFCPSRCLYCSFTSYPINQYAEKSVIYIDKLMEEISIVSEKLGKTDKRLVAVYIGGGTPTSISHELLDKLIGHIKACFNMEYVREFTVEAGRPDSITRAKLEVLKEHGITRISINPQTMNDKTLKTIGRAHTAAQVEEAFALARECGFDNINMDLIAGLPGETLREMEYTLGKIRSLDPECITVHSLAIKRAANLNQQMEEYRNSIHQETDKMLEAVYNTAAEADMKPYYLYRQKNIGGNLENVGYSKSGKECLYNILIMEELTDIVAVGAGASTKLTFHKENRVERVENCKSVDDYIERLDEMIKRKENAWV